MASIYLIATVSEWSSLEVRNLYVAVNALPRNKHQGSNGWAAIVTNSKSGKSISQPIDKYGDAMLLIKDVELHVNYSLVGKREVADLGGLSLAISGENGRLAFEKPLKSYSEQMHDAEQAVGSPLFMYIRLDF